MIIIPLLSAIEGRGDDLKKWPLITYASIFNYFIDSGAPDGEAMNNRVYTVLHSLKCCCILSMLSVYYCSACIKSPCIACMAICTETMFLAATLL